jgi:hypothetical protein
VWNPAGMVGEETVNKTDLICDEDTEAETEQARRQRQAARESQASSTNDVECGSDAHGDEHHAGNCAHSENQQVSDRPVSISNRGEHKQGDGCRTGEAMNQTHYERANVLVQVALAEDAIHPGERGVVIRVRVSMRMDMSVDEAAMGMRVSMNDFRFTVFGSGDGTKETGDVHQSEDDEHNGNRQLHAQAEANWNDEVKENDSRADDENRGGMADAPECPDERGSRTAAMICDDGGDGNDVIGVGGVAHAEKKSQGEDGEKADHYVP